MRDYDKNSRARTEDAPTEIAFPRRRLGRVEHDHLGNARMEWARLPDNPDGGRDVLKLVEDSPARSGRLNPPFKTERYRSNGFEPYQQVGGAFAAPQAAPRKPKDLRKLGEWLKMTRELEERRKRAENGDD